MFDYIKVENMKLKRTFAKKLIFIAPIVTLFITGLAPMWYQVNGFNWWYMLMLPGCIPLFCVLVNNKEEKKLNYRGVFPLPISLKKLWKAKIFLVTIYVFFSCFILLCGIAVGYLWVPSSHLISLFKGVAAMILIVITTLWQIPLCLFLAKKMGVFSALLINCGVGIVLSVIMANGSLWWLCPYSWTARLMCPVLGILPNGLLAEKGSTLLNSNVIFVGVVLSIILFILLLLLTVQWFQKQEVA
ncbi:lantibiotic immunity ABC transporter MutE/EpiE family permease subunit [Clostridium sediminicola]|uniref:lantibiotic immunity ABC transporter MutE/EpiE family permease subunit n=1 Tax=Clostridium sediminicola TaxID=3114879 RepID=UPI0031F1E90A